MGIIALLVAEHVSDLAVAFGDAEAAPCAEDL